MQEFLDSLTNVRNNGTERMDRTGTGTKAIFGTMEKYDLSLGLPAVTTKFCPLRLVISEIVWMLSGNTNLTWLHEQNNHIWDEWALTRDFLKIPLSHRMDLFEKRRITRGYPTEMTDVFNPNKTEKVALDLMEIPSMNTHHQIGDLGPIYPAMWRRVPTNRKSVVLIYKRHDVEYSVRPDVRHKFSELMVSEESSFLINGRHFPCNQNNMGRPYKIIKFDESLEYLIQFIDSKYSRLVNGDEISNEGLFIDDPYYTSSHNKSCLGITPVEASHNTLKLWKDMLYLSEVRSDVTISSRWKCFENFYNDLPSLPNYENWCQNPNSYMLDIGYYGYKVMDLNTTLFVPNELATDLIDKVEYLKVTNAGGKKKVFIDRSQIDSWTDDSSECVIKELVVPEGMVARYHIYTDPIKDVIKSLREFPHSRRHVVSSWLPQHMPIEAISAKENVLNGRAALAVCHNEFQFYIEDSEIEGRRSKLSCRFTMRSNDMFLGKPFNIAGYAILTMAIANELGLDPGWLIHMTGDAHIYTNHYDQVDTLVKRKPLPLPKLILPKGKSALALTVDDFVIEGYNHQGVLKGAVSV